MAHYAKVEDGIVTSVIVADADVIKTYPGLWVQTSYNIRGGIHYASDNNTPDGGVALRGNYAGIGYIYDSVNDVFYPPQKYASWTISAPDWIWKPPVTYPVDGKTYTWDESIKNWVEV